jgi:CBS domain-containing protein
MALVPSPCVFANETEKLGESVQRMFVEGKNSYLLLINEQKEVTGIFTRTDFVRLVSESIDTRSLFEHPLKDVMSTPVITIDVAQLSNAPKVMLKEGIEHLPIVDQSGNKDKIIGVVTSRAIFEFAAQTGSLPSIISGKSEKRGRKTLGVLSPDGSTYSLMKNVYRALDQVDVDRYQFTKFDFVRDSKKIDALILDIDNIEERISKKILSEVIKHPETEVVFVVTNKLESSQYLRDIRKIESHGLLKIFQKPLDLSRLTVELEQNWINQ